MDDTINWDAVPETTQLPQGMYRLEIEALDEAESSNGKVMFKVTFRVVEGTHEGAPLYDNYVIGSDDDPQAERQETRDKAIGMRTMKRLFKAAGVPLMPRLSECIKAAIGQHFVGVVDLVKQPARTAPDGRTFAEREVNRIVRMFPLDQTPAAPAAPAVTTQAAPAPRSTPRAAAKPAQPVGVKCGECGETVARSEILRHMQEKHPTDE